MVIIIGKSHESEGTALLGLATATYDHGGLLVLQAGETLPAGHGDGIRKDRTYVITGIAPHDLAVGHEAQLTLVPVSGAGDLNRIQTTSHNAESDGTRRNASEVHEQHHKTA